MSLHEPAVPGDAPGGEALVAVLSAAPPACAESIARALLESRVAACVNVVPGVVSLYWWQGAVARDDESLLVIKTRRSLVPALTEGLKALHPYAVPEIIALPVEPGLGNAAYRAWVLGETSQVG